MNLSELNEGDLARLLEGGPLFIVHIKRPHEQLTGLTDVVYEDGSRKTYFWGTSNPKVKKIGKGELVTKILIKEIE